MENLEPDVEILELAISREVDAYELYTALSERVQDSQMQKILEELAKEELGHKSRLELELMRLGIVVHSPEKAPAQKRGKENTANKHILDMDFKDILLFAIEKEHKALRLYIDLAAMTKGKESREMLLTLAEEEAMHRARFEVEYNLLMRKQPR